MTESVIFVYSGQPFIGEAIIHLLWAFNNEPYNDGKCSPHEREHSQIAYALIMIALESLVKIRLDEKDIKEPRELESLAEATIQGFTKQHGGYELWMELKILRNQIIHSAYFERNTKGGYTSKATENRLGSKYYKQYFDRDEECTKKWRLSINPLNVTRYEPFVGLLFFYWYGKTTNVWKSNNPLDTPDVDCRMKYNIKWINRDEYHHLVGHGKDFGYLIGYLSGRLPKAYRSLLNDLANEVLGIDLNDSFTNAKGILSMFNNDRPNTNDYYSELQSR